MADNYREKVGSLRLALESEESRTGAVEAIRALIEAVLLEPDGDRWNITLKGRSGRNAEGSQRYEEVARNGRRRCPNKAGCGGTQPTIPTSLYTVAA
jgi:hypothetical protein